MQFEDLRLIEPLLRAVRAAGYRTPTPIQINAIPIVLDGKDVLGCAQTGTGKTAAFALPVLQQLTNRTAAASKAARQPANGRAQRSTRDNGKAVPGRSGDDRRRGRIRALILCPTRELAQQIHDSFRTYGKYTGIRSVAIFGGVNQNPQVRAVQAGADVVIATPGRLLDLMNQGYVNLSNVEILVLDEADRMLEMGFLPDIRRILGKVPQQRQSLLFSATIPPPIRALAGTMLRQPVPIEVARVSSAAVTVAHRVYHVEKPLKESLLLHLLALPAGHRTLVFTRTKRGADRLTKRLDRAGVRAAALHGNKTQGARTRALDEFRSAHTPVLVATDLASRGLDVVDIAQVINYDLTSDPETYVHRIGRTGRAGEAGTAISFCTAEDRDDLRAIERLLRAPLERATMPQLPVLPPAAARSTGSTGSRSSTHPSTAPKHAQTRQRRDPGPRSATASGSRRRSRRRTPAANARS